MGCQIYHSKGVEVCYSVGAWLVVDMCSPWFDAKRDCDSDGFHQIWVDEIALKFAAAELPSTIPEYMQWRRDKDMFFQPLHNWKDSDYEQALRFVKAAAKIGGHASLSW